MKTSKVIFLVLALLVVFGMVYWVHLITPFPIHVDEWHHITEAFKLRAGEYSVGAMASEAGFHLVLAGLSYFVNLVEFYQFLPAIWAVVSGLVLFFVIYKKTENYPIALFSVLFFASIKSNVNLLGLWFFTPLTFSIPFIFLYLYFFTEGIENKNKKFILISFGIMLFLLPIHALSVLFAIPILLVYSVFHHKFIARNWKFFSIFLLVPILGMLFYSYLHHFALKNAFSAFLQLASDLRFRKGWGFLEINNSPYEIYSGIGYLFAILGAIGIFIHRQSKRYLLYLLWPSYLLLSIAYFRIFDISYFAPYQRNVYYFALVLPLFSAFGLYYLVELFKKWLDRIHIRKGQNIILAVILFFIFILAFYNYHNIPDSVALYKILDQKDYSALKFLQNQSDGRVLASLALSTAVYPVSGKDPLATMYFYGANKKDVVVRFFSVNNCTIRDDIIKKQKVRYVITTGEFDCGWKLLYSDRDFIYQT